MINEFKYTPVYIYEKVDKVNLILESCNKLEVSLASFLYITCNPFTVFSFNQSWTRRVCPIRLLESTLDWITDVDIGLLVRFLYTSLLFIFCLKKKTRCKQSWILNLPYITYSICHHSFRLKILRLSWQSLRLQKNFKFFFITKKKNHLNINADSCQLIITWICLFS